MAVAPLVGSRVRRRAWPQQAVVVRDAIRETFKLYRDEVWIEEAEIPIVRNEIKMPELNRQCEFCACWFAGKDDETECFACRRE